jgi:ADP-ribose pyrophosphatase YjhB (NUDIX family)
VPNQPRHGQGGMCLSDGGWLRVPGLCVPVSGAKPLLNSGPAHTWALRMKFCSVCGSGLSQATPAGDHRLRHVCLGCGTIHYLNPKLVVGTIPIWDEGVLLCRRAIEPRHGFWTLPAGFMECGETTGAGAVRETIEEAGAEIELGRMFSVIDVPHVDQVHVFYQARMLHPGLAPGPESLEARIFNESEVPWAQLAFRTVAQTLQWFFEDRRLGRVMTHTGEVRWSHAQEH